MKDCDIVKFAHTFCSDDQCHTVSGQQLIFLKFKTKIKSEYVRKRVCKSVRFRVVKKWRNPLDLKSDSKSVTSLVSVAKSVVDVFVLLTDYAAWHSPGWSCWNHLKVTYSHSSSPSRCIRSVSYVFSLTVLICISAKSWCFCLAFRKWNIGMLTSLDRDESGNFFLH